ncbi:MAG: hypothetical protein H6R21_183 [Proteobacteria bacterium]|nr:hypothetical protein [Pseudomonadota bacterium]
MTRFLLIALLLLAGCAAQLPPMPEDAAAKRFEPLPDKGVIYLVRPRADQDYVAPVMLDDQMIGSTYRGTYMRIEVSAGLHRLHGMASDNGSVKLDIKQGDIYFIQHNAYGYRGSFINSTYQVVNASHGRSLVMGGQMSGLITR